MKKTAHLFLVFLLCGTLAGCGYSVRSTSLGKYRTIFVEPFKNKISYSTDQIKNVYLPLLEVKLTNAIADRYLFDGNLRIKNKDRADLILQGELIGFQRDPLRYTESNDVQEYRITITVSLVLWDNIAQKPLWSEPSFGGDTTYFTTGILAKSESTALQDALTDIARRIVERTIEDWQRGNSSRAENL